ncbi:MAG TPA: protease inhibitor I42 family protein [Chthoniobacterales bacterium]|nr:protease inhibitor I42 family protein [Chthoniobacterales bacterium]
MRTVKSRVQRAHMLLLSEAVKLSVLLITALVSNFVQRSLAAPPQALTEADANHKVVLGIGQDLMVKLESNRSTGYSWSLTESENPILTSLRKPTYKISGALPGAGGVETWTLRATKIGRETLKFEYRRPWEKKMPPAKTVLFHIAVQ